MVEPRCAAIVELEHRVQAGDHGAAGAFWAQVEHRTTPLIDPIPGDADRVLLTFVFRGDAETERVVGVGWVMGSAGLQPLAHIEGTDVWHRSAPVPRGLRSEYAFAVNPPDKEIFEYNEDERKVLESSRRVDPHNPRAFQAGALAPAASVIELPGADVQPWIRELEVAHGILAPHRFESDVLGGARIVWTYEPPGYAASSGPYPLLVLQDGYSYANMGLATTLDNLIAARKIPPMVCALYQWGERIPELSCDETVAQALADDLVRKWLPSRLHVSSDRGRTAISGMSLGGLAAAFTAMRRPDVFGNVISQSGSFWWGPGATMPADMHQPGVEWEWLTREISAAKLPGVRFFMEVGVLESSPPGDRIPDMIGPNRRMRDALRAAGHEVHYREFNGGHDYVCWRGNIADALIAIAGPWVAA